MAPPKRKLAEVSSQQLEKNTYFYLSKIPDQPDNDYSLDEYWDQKSLENASNLIVKGLGKLFVWCSVVGIQLQYLYRGSETSSSLIFSVFPNNVEFVEKHLIGNHESYDKKSVCTTLLRLTFTHDKEIVAAGKLV